MSATAISRTNHVQEDPRGEASPYPSLIQRPSSTSEPERTPLHTIIFLPIDYDDPHNMSVTYVEMADNSLSTKPHKDMRRVPSLPPGAPKLIAKEDLPGYFRDEHFQRVQKRLRTIYFKPRNNAMKHFDEYADTYAAVEKGKKDEDPQLFLHQMPVFMEMLKEKNFRTIYARNLQSALRHARRLKDRLDPTSPLPYKDPKTPKTAASETFSQGPWSAREPPEQKVMLLAYRAVGSRIHMDSRAYDSHTGESVLLYPSRYEVAADSAKVHDLRAFDAIAKKYGQWRPRWHLCDLSERTDCPFEAQDLRDVYYNKVQILKRGHSSCTNHCTRVEWARFKEPACYRALQEAYSKDKDKDLFLERNPSPGFAEEEKRERNRPGVRPKRAENHILHNSHFFNYIHQEFVDSLESWGELRVFIAMKYDKDKRGQPEVVDIIRTNFNIGIEHQVGKGYGVNYNRKDVTAQVLRGYCKARGLLATGKKEDLKALLRANDDYIKANGDNGLEGTTPAGDGRDPRGGSNAKPPGERIIRCTYLSASMNVSRLDLESTEGFEKYPKVTIPAIKRFALQQYRRLHRRFPRQFESLNVGARIDIGVNEKQELFINEVTRWWFASWFGGFEDIGRQDTVAQAFADSFGELYKADLQQPGEPNEESDDDKDDYDNDPYTESTEIYKEKRAKRKPKRPRVGRVEGSGGSKRGGKSGGGRAGRKDNPTPDTDRDDDQDNGVTSKENTKQTRKKPTPTSDIEKDANDGDEGSKKEKKAPRRSHRIAGKRASEEADDDDTMPLRKKAKGVPKGPRRDRTTLT